ncbi:MAG: M23 family metallopeptidase [Bacteroidia bacterium]
MKALKLGLLSVMVLLASSFSSEPIKRPAGTQSPDHAFFSRQFAHMNRIDRIDLPQVPSLYPLAQTEKVYFASPFGMRNHPVLKRRKLHPGQDFAAPKGTPVIATGDGIIARTVTDPSKSGYGKQIIIEHEEAFESECINTRYAHLSKLLVRAGQSVSRGDTIALSGNTGLSTAPHLHYEVIQNGKQVDPAMFIL